MKQHFDALLKSSALVLSSFLLPSRAGEAGEEVAGAHDWDLRCFKILPGDSVMGAFLWSAREGEAAGAHDLRHRCWRKCRLLLYCFSLPAYFIAKIKKNISYYSYMLCYNWFYLIKKIISSYLYTVGTDDRSSGLFLFTCIIGSSGTFPFDMVHMLITHRLRWTLQDENNSIIINKV